jgi:cation transport ATPase
MTPELRIADEATFRRRRAVVTATVLSSLGVVALALRESAPHPGRISSPVVLGVGVLVYVAPFAFSVDRAMRRGRTRMAVVAFIGGAGGAFLATRALGSFSQAWPLFTAIVSIVVLHAIGQFQRDQSP